MRLAVLATLTWAAAAAADDAPAMGSPTPLPIVTVTAEHESDGYFVERSRSATRTDTALIDVPTHESNPRGGSTISLTMKCRWRASLRPVGTKPFPNPGPKLTSMRGNRSIGSMTPICRWRTHSTLASTTRPTNSQPGHGLRRPNGHPSRFGFGRRSPDAARRVAISGLPGAGIGLDGHGRSS